VSPELTNCEKISATCFEKKKTREKLSPPQAMSDYCVARIYLEKGQCSEALDVFNKINDGHGIGFHDGNQFMLNNDFGFSLVCQGAHKEAIGILQEGESF
jgi:hypothetical protein